MASSPRVACWRPVLSASLSDLSLTLQRSDTAFLRSRLVLVKRVQIVREHVSIVELDNGYVVCRLKNFRMLYWIMDTNDMHARTDKILN